MEEYSAPTFKTRKQGNNKHKNNKTMIRNYKENVKHMKKSTFYGSVDNDSNKFDTIEHKAHCILIPRRTGYASISYHVVDIEERPNALKRALEFTKDYIRSNNLPHVYVVRYCNTHFVVSY